jgi:hypothetical protein
MASVSTNATVTPQMSVSSAPVSSTNNINKQLNNRIKTAERKPNNKADLTLKQSSTDNGFMNQINNALDNTSNYLKSLTTSSATKPQNNKEAGKESGKASGNITNKQIIPDSMIYITDNYIIILGLFIAFVILVLLYFFSKTFNVGRVKEKMKLYNLYQKISDYDYRESESGTRTLKDVQVASAYNAANMGSQMLSYTSEHILNQVLRSGARYIELNIFASKFGQDAIPVIDGGFKRGEWKLMLNTTTFEQAIITIAQNAFKPLETEGGAPNSGDPLFLALNLSTGHNIYCLDKVADILVDYLSDKLLEPKYAYQFNKNIQDIKMNELQGKVIIFASSGYEGSKLEELVNSTWVDETQTIPSIIAVNEGFMNKTNNKRDANKTDSELNTIKKSMTNKKQMRSGLKNNTHLNKDIVSTDIEDKSIKLSEVIKREFGKDRKEKYQDIELQQPSLDDDNNIIQSSTPNIIRISASIFSNPGFDAARIKNHNKTGLTIVVPHIEGDYLTRNYDPTPAWDLGCQFVTMNYQEIDENMDTYITHFETKAILPIA